MAYKVRMTAPKSQIEGWNGRISVNGGATWVRLTKYVGGELVAFDSKAQLLKEAAKVARRAGGGRLNDT
jgi:hypothetical protein